MVRAKKPPPPPPVGYRVKYYSLAVPNSGVPNGLKIEHLCDIIPKAQSWLVLNLSVFMFVYIHFNVPPTRRADLVRNVSDERFIDMEQSPLSIFLLFINLVCVQSVIQLMNTPFITFVVWIKEFSISFSK